jgi:tRNA threonylcarbamoyladenosine biosynthesis protein TsaB
VVCGPLRVLAIDTALEACSAAVLDTERMDDTISRSLPMMRGHAEALMPLVAAVMSAADIEFTEVDRIAVTVGPGSFTGLRVGVAAARGIALATGRPAVGLTTLAALAAPFFEADESRALLTVVDARHNQVYMQLFGPGGRSLIAPRLASLREAIRAAMASPTRIVGNAAKLIEDAWPDNERRPPLVSVVRAPDVAWIARLGAAAKDLTTPVRPLYLREAGAHPQEAGILPRR